MRAGGRFEPGKRAYSPSIHKVIHHPARRFPAKAWRMGTLRELLPQTGGMSGLPARFDGVANLGGKGGLALEQVVDRSAFEDHDLEIVEGADANVSGGDAGAQLVAKAFAGPE